VTSWRLVSDVGGSNVRFARSSEGHTLSSRQSYRLADFPSFYSALQTYLDGTGGADGCVGAAIGVAGPVDGDHVELTNADWRIETGQVQPLIGGASARLVNDLQAVALALPYLRDEELTRVGSCERRHTPRRTMLALNVGTGFGAAAIIPVAGGWEAIPGEPGHMSIGAVDAEELGLIEGAACVEDLLSGRGVAKLYARVAARAGAEAGALNAAQTFSRAGTDPVAAETVRKFSRLLGRVAGDIAVATVSWGGVYLCGSVITGWAEAGGAAFFREPFEQKGVMSERFREVYTGIIRRGDVALIGLTYLPIGGG
jgi:glucokinase